MTLVKHELKQGKTSFLVWTVSIGFLLAVCVFLFPEMKGQMDGISETFASMGSFTAAFGMDRLNFGTLIGGAVAIETVFAIPGVGRLMIDSIKLHDTPTVIGCMVFVSVMVSVINLLVDLLYALIDPRIKAQYLKGGKK